MTAMPKSAKRSNAMIFELRQYDKTLLTFELEEKYLEGQVCRLISVEDENEYLLPQGLTVSGEGILSWLKTRVIPKNREFVDQILSRYGLSHNDTLGVIKICKGLSLNDSYWVVERGFEGKFWRYNLYENNFTQTLSLIAFTGYGSSSARGFTSSPEFTTNGMLRKCWRRINKKIYLYKGGTVGASNAGLEPYSEFYAAQIAKQMGLKHVDYSLAKWKNIICSTCELFTDINTSYVPIYKFVEKCTIPVISEFLKGLGKEYYDEFADMMIFDSLIFNTDRHAGNFGLLVDNKTNKPIAFAPIFDNGLSLFNYAIGEELDDLITYSKSRTSAFNVSYNDIIAEFISDRQREQLRKMINFKFTKHAKYNLSAERLKKLEDFLQHRVNELLNFRK